ncbi:MAG: acyltransferase family protein [Acidobacteria bacterium]|nr:acyltransferase family protein [Acidobacteriota bacterium]
MSRPSITYQPALDGVRAVAVATVLLFHAGLSWMGGGYLGVSVFFTLSGFLITSLLLAEHAATGSVGVAAFYTRRAKRLLPASLLCLVLVCILAAAGLFDGLANLRRDVLGALFQVFNWVKLASGESYADLTAAQAGLRRPLDHYWSLAIEEQFYWLWPVAFLGVVAWCRRRGRSPMQVVGVLTAVFTVAAPVVAQVWGPDAAYWATPARIGEILFGALAACVVAVRPPSGRAAWWAPVGLLAILVACVLFPDGRGPAYEGALPLVGAVSALMIYGLQVPGPTRSLLSTRPLVALGKVSYGVYLFHWPVYVLVDRQAWNLPVVADLAVKWSIVAAVTVASYFLLERPVRRSERLVPRSTLAAALAATAAVSALVLVVPSAAKYYGVDDSQAQAASIVTGSVAPLPTAAPTTTRATAPTSTLPGTTTTVTLVPPRPVRIMVVGDSTAEATGAGLVAWAAANPQQAQVALVTGAGCGLVLAGFQNLAFGDRDTEKECGPYVREVIPEKVRELQPDVVVVLSSVWDVLDRRLTAEGPELPPTDPSIEAAITYSLTAFTDGLLAQGVPKVVWLRQPVPLPTPTAAIDLQSQPERHAVLHRVIDGLAEGRPMVRVVALDKWVEEAGLAADEAARPDKVHWTTEAATRIATDFLGPTIVREALT